MEMTERQFRNLRQWRGRPPEEITAAYGSYRERIAAVESPLQAVAAAENPREAIDRLLPMVVRDLERWLALESRRGKPEPSVTSRLAECRQLIAAATAYAETSGPADAAQRIAEEIVRRLIAANFDERSPAGPPPIDEDT